MSRSCDYAQRSFFLSIFPTTQLHTRKNSFFDPLTCSILVFGPVSFQNFVWYIDLYFSAILVQLLIRRFFLAINLDQVLYIIRDMMDLIIDN